MRDFQLIKARDPPIESLPSADAETGCTDAVVPVALSRGMRPVEKGEIAPGRSLGVCVKKEVSAQVILVDGLFDQTHPENLRVKLMVGARIRGDGGDVMDSK